jgi:hypothetical protein
MLALAAQLDCLASRMTVYTRYHEFRSCASETLIKDVDWPKWAVQRLKMSDGSLKHLIAAERCMDAAICQMEDREDSIGAYSDLKDASDAVMAVRKEAMAVTE